MAIEKFVVSRDESVYEAWPDLIKTVSGKLLCVFTECEHHICRKNSRIVITESLDRGRTWSEKRPVSEESNQEFFFDNARFSQLSDGRIALICNRHGSESAGGAVQYLWFSSDEGKTFCEPTVLNFCGRALELLFGLGAVAFFQREDLVHNGLQLLDFPLAAGTKDLIKNSHMNLLTIVKMAIANQLYLL